MTIDRPDSRNSLHPPAKEELDEAFDAYFADPELWVAILSGSGDKAFCAGNDLVCSAPVEERHVRIVIAAAVAESSIIGPSTSL